MGGLQIGGGLRLPFLHFLQEGYVVTKELDLVAELLVQTQQVACIDMSQN